MSDLSLIAVDLDGTLLTSQQNVAPEGAWLLQRAHRQGVRAVELARLWQRRTVDLQEVYLEESHR